MNERDERRLAELVRQGERILDQQLAIARVQQEKSRYLMATAIAFLTAAVAAFQFPFDDFPVPLRWLLGMCLAIATMLHLHALLCFSAAYIGRGRQTSRIQGGWEGQALVDECETGFELAQVHRSTLRGIHRWVKHNQRTMNQLLVHRLQGMRSLTVGVSLLVVALIYVVMANAV